MESTMTALQQPNQDGWAAALDQLEGLTQSARPHAVGDVAQFVWSRLCERSGPPIDYLRGEEPDALLKWLYRSTTSAAVKETMYAAFDLLMRQHLPDTVEAGPELAA